MEGFEPGLNLLAHNCFMYQPEEEVLRFTKEKNCRENFKQFSHLEFQPSVLMSGVRLHSAQDQEKKRKEKKRKLP